VVFLEILHKNTVSCQVPRKNHHLFLISRISRTVTLHVYEDLYFYGKSKFWFRTVFAPQKTWFYVVSV